MSHFTYKDTINKDVLKQGDVILKTEKLTEIIKEVHPYFVSDTYKYFLVLTQSCDLIIRRGNKCTSKYITIAAIRPLEDALMREAESVFSLPLEKKTKKVIDEKNGNKLINFLSRLFNNNIPDYFYLHHAVDSDFVSPSVAFLRVSIALKSELHYSNCLESKILELEESFQAKLGWLVGNLYSRVGTEDWVPGVMDQNNFNSYIKSHLQSHFQIISNLSQIESILKKNYSEEQISKMSVDDIVYLINETKVLSRKEKVISRVIEILSDAQGVSNTNDLSKLELKFKNDQFLTEFLK